MVSPLVTKPVITLNCTLNNEEGSASLYCLERTNHRVQHILRLLFTGLHLNFLSEIECNVNNSNQNDADTVDADLYICLFLFCFFFKKQPLKALPRLAALRARSRMSPASVSLAAGTTHVGGA